MDFRRVPPGARWIYIGNNTRVEVKGIGTCKLELRSSQTLILHDVLFAPEIRRNLVSVIVLLKLGYDLNFARDRVCIYNSGVFYGTGHLLNGFLILDCDRQMFNCYTDRYISLNVCSSSNANIDDKVWHARLGHTGRTG